MDKKEFIEKYPATLLELLTSPCVFRETILSASDLPYPGINHLRDICEYANYTYGALRTALSRTIKAKKLDFFHDAKKIKRFRLTANQQNVSKALLADIGDAEDFSLVVFSFRAEQEQERRDARLILQSYGFRLFAQNTYIRRRIKREPFENSLKEYGLQNNLFLLECADPGTTEFKERLFSQFEMDKMVNLTNTFLIDLDNFLNDRLEAAEFSKRLLYAGPVYYNICFANEVPIPAAYFPENYRIKELKHYFQSIPAYRWKDFTAYYLNIENQGE